MNNRSGEDTRGLDRIIFFSDAVFAIVMTLLILDISVPDIPQDSATAELPARVLDLWSKFFSYALSFMVIGTYWMAHHGTFRYFRTYDRMLMWLNLLFLLSISFVPFPTALLGEYGEQQFAVVLVRPFPCRPEAPACSDVMVCDQEKLANRKSRSKDFAVSSRTKLGDIGSLFTFDSRLIL